jgi:hypothetical protein
MKFLIRHCGSLFLDSFSSRDRINFGELISIVYDLGFSVDPNLSKYTNTENRFSIFLATSCRSSAVYGMKVRFPLASESKVNERALGSIAAFTDRVNSGNMLIL